MTSSWRLLWIRRLSEQRAYDAGGSYDDSIKNLNRGPHKEQNYNDISAMMLCPINSILSYDYPIINNINNCVTCMLYHMGFIIAFICIIQPFIVGLLSIYNYLSSSYKRFEFPNPQHGIFRLSWDYHYHSFLRLSLSLCCFVSGGFLTVGLIIFSHYRIEDDLGAYGYSFWLACVGNGGIVASVPLSILDLALLDDMEFEPL